MRTIKHLFSFHGRVRRTHYFYLVLFSTALALAAFAGFSDGREPPKELQTALLVVGGVVLVVMVVVNISFTVRRLHDMSLSGWTYLLLIVAQFIPLARWVILAWLVFGPGRKGPNSFGPDPRAPKHENLVDVFDAPPEGSRALGDGLKG